MPRTRFDPDAVEGLIRRHCGVVRVADLVRAGLRRQTIAHRCRPRGRWQRVLSGVVLACNGRPTLVQRLLAAVLYAGPGAVLTGFAALRLRGFRDLPTDHTVHLLVPHRRRRASGAFVVVERTTRLPPHTWVQKIPRAPVARAVIDGTRRADDLDVVRAVIAEAVQRGFCRLPDLLQELAEAQIRGTRLPRQALREVMAGVRSVAEAKAREALRGSDLPAPLWNHDLYDESGTWLGRPDAFWPDHGVVLEIDSRTWHLSPRSWRRTRARQRRMTKYGLLVIAVAPTELSENTAAIIGEIQDTLDRAVDRPTPKLVARPPVTT